MTIDPNDLAATAVKTFGEEFDNFRTWDGVAGLDPTGGPQWSGRVTAAGTLPYNNELQYYIDASAVQQGALPNPFTLSDGVLTISARPADALLQPSIDGQHYTSGLINTFHEFSQTYGYFEMRAELPAGRGLWPAFWLLPEDGSWPPELDVMEMLGHETGKLHTTVHSQISGAQQDGPNHFETTATALVPDMTTGFHRYGVDWEPDSITWYFDGHQVFQTATPADMNKPMYMIANLAVGGDWPGAPDATTTFPADMHIDYIRAYSALPEVSTLPVAPDTIYSDASCTVPAGAHNLILTGTAKDGIGNDLDNVLIGNDLPNTLVGGPGADTMAGGKGDDIYGVDSPGDYVVERPGEGFDTVYASVNYTMTDNVEALILTGGATAGTGNGSDNVLIGNILDNTLIGGAGNDLMAGGAGNDIYGVDSPGDYVIETPNAGFDTVYSSVNYTLTANVEALILTGTAQDAIGNDLDNVLIGNAADNRILGGAGNDTMAGGGGSDTFLFAPGFGHDEITDFTAGSGAGHDVLAFDHTIFYDMTDVIAHSHQSGSNVVIEANANDTITLHNVTLANLTASDFHFL